jgi:hypothetical protein
MERLGLSLLQCRQVVFWENLSQNLVVQLPVVPPAPEPKKKLPMLILRVLQLLVMYWSLLSSKFHMHCGWMLQQE